MLLERLGKELLFFDGGMGTLLQAEGLQPGELPETWNIERKEKFISHILRLEVILCLRTHLERTH